MCDCMEKNLNEFFHPATEEEILQRRLSGRPGLVMKLGDEIYLATREGIGKVDKYDLGDYKCCNCEKMLRCPKVMETPKEYYREQDFEDNPGLIFGIKRIEKYSFIQKGLELFNAGRYEYFIVSECEEFKRESPRRAITLEQASAANDARVSLAQTIWPDIDDLTQLKQRMAQRNLTY